VGKNPARKKSGYDDISSQTLTIVARGIAEATLNEARACDGRMRRFVRDQNDVFLSEKCADQMHLRTGVSAFALG